ncbi:MAG: ATP-binding cassette domain-containing protein [Acutalibacteraceae bacterium]|nr:ATP-binding cassette domain-containing protein [Acutalibacteraceae bacterium]
MELNIRGIEKHFGEKEVLKDISLTAKSGAALGLLGRNGAGKTTTIRIVMGVFFPDKGEILYNGKPLDRKKVRIGYMPEERGLYPKKRIDEQLIYLAMLRGMNKADARQACDKWLDRMGMNEYKVKKLETLSKGNQQKIQLAATLMCNPQIIILDEPFSGLDPVNAMLLKDVIKEMIDGGAVVLFSSHQMNYIEEFCDSIAILNGGKIVLDGRITDIKHSYPRNKIAVTSSQIEQIAPFVLQYMSGEVLSAEPEKGVENTLLIRMQNPAAKTKLLQGLSDKGFDIDAFRVCEPSMNDIFVQYTEVGI